MRWLIVTGEYPPPPGGVGDHVEVVARELVALGDQVEILAPPAPHPREAAPGGPRVQSLPGGYGPRGLGALRRRLRALPSDTRILLEYVPQAFGMWSLNLPLCLVLALDAKQPLDVMFHEVCYWWTDAWRVKDNVLAAGQRVMAGVIANSAARLFLSTDSWRPVLAPLLLRPKPTITAPVPSTLPRRARPDRVEELRHAWDPGGDSFVIGHFGTYGAHITRLLTPLLRRLLASGGKRRLVLLGRGSREFARSLRAELAVGCDRVEGLGESPPLELVAALSACDVLVQPYPEGVTTRRSSLIAALALGRAVVTNRGQLTEPLWNGLPGVMVAPSLQEMEREVARLEADAAALTALRAQAAATYDLVFAPRRTAEALRDLSRT